MTPLLSLGAKKAVTPECQIERGGLIGFEKPVISMLAESFCSACYANWP